MSSISISLRTKGDESYPVAWAVTSDNGTLEVFRCEEDLPGLAVSTLVDRLRLLGCVIEESTVDDGLALALRPGEWQSL